MQVAKIKVNGNQAGYSQCTGIKWHFSGSFGAARRTGRADVLGGAYIVMRRLRLAAHELRRLGAQ
jgi:hypothetical protein